MMAEIRQWRLEDGRRRLKASRRKGTPNSARAVCDAYIATIDNGRRVIRFYKSGQLLRGALK